jgi:hypothetical protein
MPNIQNDSAKSYNIAKIYFLEREIANFNGYLGTLSGAMSVREDELSTKKDIVANDFISQSDEIQEELIYLKNEAYKVKGFANLLRQSFLTSLYSFMELWLVRECHVDSAGRDGGESYRTIKSKGIVKAKQYFSKIMGSDYPFGSSQDWQWIMNFQRLRDCIVHRQGSLTGLGDFEVDAILAAFVSQENGLSLFGKEKSQIFIEHDFCERALQTVHRFMVELLDL